MKNELEQMMERELAELSAEDREAIMRVASEPLAHVAFKADRDGRHVHVLTHECSFTLDLDRLRVLPNAKFTAVVHAAKKRGRPPGPKASAPKARVQVIRDDDDDESDTPPVVR